MICAHKGEGGGCDRSKGSKWSKGSRGNTLSLRLPSTSVSRSSGKLASNHNLTGASAVRRLVKNVSVLCNGVSSLGGEEGET